MVRFLNARNPLYRSCFRHFVQVRRLNDFRPTAGKRRGAPPRPSCETTASTPAAAREAPKFSSALRAVAVVAVVECRYTYVAAQLSCRKKVHVARKNAPGRLESARRCVSKDVALQVWGRIRHTGRFSLLCWPTVMTPSRHRRLVLAYDSNPSSDGSVLVSATPPARHHYCPPTPLRPRPHPRWQGFTRAPAQVQQQPEHVLAYTNEYLSMRSGPRAAEGVHCTHSHAGTSAAPQWGKRGIWG